MVFPTQPSGDVLALALRWLVNTPIQTVRSDFILFDPRLRFAPVRPPGTPPAPLGVRGVVLDWKREIRSASDKFASRHRGRSAALRAAARPAYAWHYIVAHALRCRRTFLRVGDPRTVFGGAPD